MAEKSIPRDEKSEPLQRTILIVDDEKNIRRTLSMVLEGEGYATDEAETAEQALSMLAAPKSPVDLVVLDVKLPGMSGLEALEKMKADEALKTIPVIVISGHATVHDAINAIKLGAADFFEKPVNRERVVVSVRNVLDRAFLSRELTGLRADQSRRFEMIGRSAPMRKLFGEIDKVAPTKASVLITGQSGTGKELISRAIHNLSPRKDAPFIKVNCAAIPRELIESELFGHERGSFTGAQARKRGVFEQAHGGTLFLDEIGDMDLTAQAKVLRALQQGEISRVGSEHVINVDVRVLAATNKDLEAEAKGGRFRDDLFFRLNVFPIRSPALRDRVEDIPLLAQAFLEAFCRDNGLKLKPIDGVVIRALQERKWPGNVRELKNVVERMAILSGDRITIADLPEDPHDSPFGEDDAGSSGTGSDADLDDDAPTGGVSTAIRTPPGEPAGERETLRDFRDRVERAYIVDTLKVFDWNISRASVVLGVERTNLHKKIRSYGIKRGEG